MAHSARLWPRGPYTYPVADTSEGCGLASSDWLKFAGVPLLIGLVVCMRTAQEWHPVENAFLEPLEREIDHRCDIQGNERR